MTLVFFDRILRFVVCSDLLIMNETHPFSILQLHWLTVCRLWLWWWMERVSIWITPALNAKSIDPPNAIENSVANTVFGGGTKETEANHHRIGDVQYGINVGRRGHRLRCTHVERIASASKTAATTNAGRTRCECKSSTESSWICVGRSLDIRSQHVSRASQAHSVRLQSLQQLIVIVVIVLLFDFDWYSSALPSFSTLPDDRPLRFTDSPQHGMTSTTTSGLGSNYTNTSSGLTLPPTPSPRRKQSMGSFNEMAEIEAKADNNRSPYFYPGRQFNYREPFQSDFRPKNYIQDDYASMNRDAGYFGKINLHRMWFTRIPSIQR